ncbi:hypothetical protein TBH_C0760 [Thiolapillus brandeum]|uniref:DUF11 domain-containing protein n=1 Tax=Thiolapillus brandeum TaxID=1076588 RepID=A0A7U6GHH0_9GAMM|nr:hypothetical protein TBH_C0760 [Thiolapillus brandeum]
MEAAAIYLDGITLYAADADQLGILDTATGNFTPTSSTFGTGSGAQGNIPFTDVDGLAFDALTGYFYGSERQGAEDLLFRIDRTTGAHVPDAFGPGVDYVVIQTQAEFGGLNLDDIDDIAIDPRDGQMYAVANNGGTADHLVKVDKMTGAVTDVAVFTNASGGANVTDMEGLGFYNNGVFYGTTGTSSTSGNSNSLWEIDLATATATRILDINSQSGRSDYEGVGCLTGGGNHITGKVFVDNNRDGVDDGGNGWANVDVQLFRDLNGNGVVDAGDLLVQTQTTAADGTYDFLTASQGPFVVRLDINTLPANNSFTTDNVETAVFPIPPSTSPTFGATDSGNDFGLGPGVKTISGTVFEDILDGDGVRDTGEPGQAGVTVHLYEDTNNNGIVDAGDHLSGSTVTDANGDYSFVAGPGNFVLDVDPTTLPSGATQTTNPPDHTQTASFTNSTTNETDSGNDFGFTLPPGVLGVTKTSNIPGTVSLGDTIDYTITITNNGSIKVTNIIVTDDLPTETSYQANSTVVQGYIPSGSDYFEDDFSTGGYGGNSGTLSFSGGWVETTASGSNIHIDNDADCPVNGDDCLEIHTYAVGDNIYRELDLSAYNAAQLSYDFNQENFGSVEGIAVEVSSDGGATYTVLKYYSGAALIDSDTFDITPYISANTRIRFRTNGLVSGGNLNVDNVRIDVKTFTAATKDNVAGGVNPDLDSGVPSTLVTGNDDFGLAPGQSMTVTYSIQVNDPVAAAFTEVNNVVSVTSDQTPTPVHAMVSDPIAYEYGDTPADGDTIANGATAAYGDPSHMLSSLLYMGSAADGAPDDEAGTQHSADATGDDGNGTDDDNGVVFSYSADYSQITATVTYNNTTGADAVICGWLDGAEQATGLADGSFDAVEGKCITVPDNSGSPNSTVSFTWDNSGAGNYIPVGDTFARFRISSDTTMGTGDAATAAVLSGEVEDYQLAGSRDYDDLPAGYGSVSHALPHLGDTTTASPSAVWLGDASGSPDAEASTQAGDGDDTDGNDDEAGVAFRSPGGTNHSVFADVTVNNNTGGTVTVCGWFDVPSAGDTTPLSGPFTASDGICQTVSTQGQSVVTLSWPNMPTDKAYTTYARFRVSSGTLTTADFTGDAIDGEVEGYPVNIDFTPTVVTIGSVELGAFTLSDYMAGLGLSDLGRQALLDILAKWSPEQADALSEANREAILEALADYLDPDGDGQVAVLNWDTLEERGTIGFWVERRQDSGDWVQINQRLLPGLITAPMGGEYLLADPEAKPGNTYHYRLIEQEATGNTRVYGPYTVEMP